MDGPAFHELRLEVVPQIGAIVDDVRLVGGQDRIAGGAWLRWHVAVAVDGDQLGGIAASCLGEGTCLILRPWALPPVGQPEATPDVVEDAVRRPGESKGNIIRGGPTPLRPLLAPGQTAGEEVPEIWRELETMELLDPSELSS